ncbi:hypothetical protein ACLOJK_032036 [Asimina triloba]
MVTLYVLLLSALPLLLNHRCFVLRNDEADICFRSPIMGMHNQRKEITTLYVLLLSALSLLLNHRCFVLRNDEADFCFRSPVMGIHDQVGVSLAPGCIPSDQGTWKTEIGRKTRDAEEGNHKMGHTSLRSLERTISSLEMQLATARAAQASDHNASPMATKLGTEQPKDRPKVFFVMGIITAFNSRKRRDSIRHTWMPQGSMHGFAESSSFILNKCGFLNACMKTGFLKVSCLATSGGVLERTIDAEEEQFKDFLRLDHIEGYHELPTKTQIYFTTAVAKWDADFYIKVDDDVHVNPEGSSTMNLNTGNLARREISTYYTDMLMRMYHWVLGSLVLMLSTLMNGAYAVGLPQIVNGKPKQGTLVPQLLIGAAVAFVNQWKEWRRYTSAVEKVMGLSGMLNFESWVTLSLPSNVRCLILNKF